MCYPKGFFASQGDIGTMSVLHKVIKKKSSPVFKFLAACALAQFILSSPVFAANVVLKNGDRLTGEIIKLSDNILTFKSPLFGEVELPWKQVVELQSDDGVAVKLKDGSIAKGRVTLSSQGELVIDQDDLGRSKPLQKTDIAMFNPPVVDRAVKYSGRANFGGVFNRGNSEDDALNFDTELIARTPESRYTVAAEVNEAESAGETTTSNRYLLTQYDAFLSEKDPSVSFALNYERKFWNKRLVFFNNNNLSVSLEDMADSLLKTKVGLRVPIVENVNVATQVNVDYNNMPPPGVKKTDSSLIFSVGYGF